jgi:hypothetical protein
VEALLAHHAGATDVTLVTLNDKLDGLLALLPPVIEGQGAMSAPRVRVAPRTRASPTDGLNHLDHLGL